MTGSQKAVIRYWERRRIIYNVALVPASLFAYLLSAGLAYVGDPHDTLYSFVMFWFALSAVGANMCYSFVYSLEFFFFTEDPASRWSRYGRAWTFIGGLAFAMILALLGGRNIAMMEFYEQVKRMR
jgi:hypothetical protein